MSELTYYPVSLSTKDSLSRNLPTDEPNDDIEDSGISFQNAIQSLSKQLSQLKTNTSKRWEALSKRIIKLDQTLSTIEIQTDTQLPESSLFRTTHNPLPSSHSFTPSGIEARLTFLRTMSSQATTSPLFGGNTPKHPQTTTSATFSPFSKRGRTGLYSPQTKIDAGDLVTAQQGLLSVEEEQKMERRLPGLQHIVNQLEEELSTLKNEDGSEINSHNLPLLALPSSMALSSLLRLISPQTFSFSVLQAVNSRLKELHQLSLQQNSLLESLQRLKAAQKPGILKEDPLITQLKRIEKKRKDLDEKVKSLAQQAIAMEQDLTLMKKQAGQKKGHR
ncbi:hypothetical protein BLNAU_2611 [Blattamonas nauphoetae]|uniref:Uncharacterized protein n=1 Tax=Blattamonas nauphoetae TaxID=2049346 RepID=A0ABQ9YF27_9EUKA|nr:hypothetical protein BLNAU_2611 [Blattamonas nauphoetae]